MAPDPECPSNQDAEVLAFPGSRPDPGLRDLIGEVLRKERQDQGRTLVDVAEEAAVSVQYLSEVERGRKEVSSDLLEAMHRALGLDLSDVLERASRRLRVGSERSSGNGNGNGPLMLAA